MKMKIALLSLALLGLGACAAPPTAATLDKLPVVDFGKPVPANGDYILHFTAGKPIPTQVEIGGNLFQQPARHTLTVKLKQDIYSYKNWISYDKQHWVSGRDALAVKMNVKIPGYTYPHPGHIRLDLSQK